MKNLTMMKDKLIGKRFKQFDHSNHWVEYTIAEVYPHWVRCMYFNKDRETRMKSFDKGDLVRLEVVRQSDRIETLKMRMNRVYTSWYGEENKDDN